MNTIIKFGVLGAILGLGTTAAGQIPQLPNPTPDRRVLDLQLDDLQLRSDVATQRVNRQAEVARLEARVEELESRIKALETNAGPTLWPFLDLIDAEQPEHAGSRSGQDDAPGAESRPGSSADVGPNASNAASDRRLRLARLMAEDYLLALQADLVDARIELVDANQSVGSIQRLLAKGLATGLQLKREQLESTRAAARVQRLEKQTAGLRELFPDLAQPTSPAQSADELPIPSPAADVD